MCGKTQFAHMEFTRNCHSERIEESHTTEDEFDTRVGTNLCVVPWDSIGFLRAPGARPYGFGSYFAHRRDSPCGCPFAGDS